MFSGNINIYILLMCMVRFGGGGVVIILNWFIRFNGIIDYKSFDKREEYKWYKCREMKYKWMVIRKNIKKKNKSI